MTTAKLFMNGRSQAVRLPKEFRFEGQKVFIKRMGEGVLLMPEQRDWDAFFATCDQFSEDLFPDGRPEQPPQQERPLLDTL